MFNHIIWDFDGTLFNSYPVMAKAFQDALRDMGFTEPIDIIEARLRITMDHAKQYFKDKYNLSDEFNKIYKKHITKRSSEISIYNGVKKLCGDIYLSGGKNYLFTHRGASSIELIKDNGIDGFFSDYITSQNGFERKPSPEAINYLISKHCIIREETLMVGDRELDILSAKNAGICACYFSEGGDTCELADFSVRNFYSMYPILGLTPRNEDAEGEI